MFNLPISIPYPSISSTLISLQTSRSPQKHYDYVHLYYEPAFLNGFSIDGCEYIGSGGNAVWAFGIDIY